MQMIFSTDSYLQYQRDVRARREYLQQTEEHPHERQHALVEMNLPLVITLARRYQVRGVDLLDLIQEGNLGLLRAAQKFDPSLGVQFSTYAAFWVKAALLAALAQRNVALSASRGTGERLQRLLRLKRDMQEETGRPPTVADLATAMNVTVPVVLALLTLQQGDDAASLDAQMGEHEEDTLASLLEADPEQRPEQQAFLHQRNEHLRRLLFLLTKAERQVILWRYGLRDGEGHPYEDIARRMHVGSDNVRSLEQRALMKLRRYATLLHIQDFVD